MDEKEIKKHLFVNILCGGGGTRLWPQSRKKTPKQFIPLFDKKTIFQQTVERALELTSADKIFVITNADYVDEVIQQGKIILPRNIIAEPEKKNTALAMGVASVFIGRQDSQAVVVNLASDQLISPLKTFYREMMQAVKAACRGDYLVTVGIKPTSPHTGYGYIKAGKKVNLGKNLPAYKVERFTEKPNLAKARRFLREGHYYWNANLYTWKVGSMIKAFKVHAPQTAGLLGIMKKAVGTENENKVMKRIYRKAVSISIDYALAEKAQNMILIPSTFNWSDVGDWKAVYDLSPLDRQGNLVDDKSRAILINTQDCLIKSDKKLVGAIGLENLVVIDTADALLICRKDKAQDVKKMVDLLQEKGKEEYL